MPISLACSVVLISILYLVSLVASLALSPFLPIASEKLSPSAITNASFFLGSVIKTVNSLAGLKAFSINTAGSLSYLTISTFSPLSSVIILAIRAPLYPIHAPIGCTLGFSEYTATLLLTPASLATL